MKKKVGIWMDKRSARIIAIDEEGAFLTTIESEVDDFNPTGGSGSRVKGGPQDVVQDSKYTEREKHQLKDYFAKVIDSLPEPEALVVFGPAQTGQKFADELQARHTRLHEKLRSVEKADSMTDNQAIAWVKGYFG